MPDPRPILYVVGLLLCGLAAAMLVPAAADAALANPDWRVFLASASATGFFGMLLVLTNRGRKALVLDVRQAFLLTTAAWSAMGAFSALPFLFLGQGLDYTDAFFEAVSGLTTTGSTVLVGLDGMPPGILLWRAILQWIGGIGIIVMAIIVLPFLRVGGMQLFRSESSERSEKVVARPYELVSYIALIYLGLTAACFFAYWAAGMSAFDALCHAMTTLATGGFSTHDASFTAFGQPAIQWLAVLFMLLGSLPFVAYIRTLQRRQMPIWRDSQVRGFLAFVASASLAVTAWLAWTTGIPAVEALRLAIFNVTSIVTTTGYASADYMEWAGLAVGIFLFLTVVGGCTGSTAGGIKFFRHQVLWVVTRSHLRFLIRPHVVSVATYQGRALPDDIAPSVLAFIFVFLASVAVVALGLSGFGLDLVTSLSGAATAVSNVGPGLGPIIGPAGNFGTLPDGAKWLLAGAMLLGRLELFTVLVLFQREFWRW